MRVLLDTNFLIDAVKFKIDLKEIDELIGRNELIMLSSVERELEKISKGGSKAGRFAKVALNLMKEQKMKILKSEIRPDNAMLELADEKILVATNDIELRRRLKTLGRKTIYLKSKKHLAIG